MTAFQVMNQDFIKLDRFDGKNFTRWQDMMFLLSALKVQYVQDPNLPLIPKITDDDSNETKAAWKGYKKKLLRTTEDFTVEQILKHLRIEEKTRVRDKSFSVNFNSKNENSGGNKRKLSETNNFGNSNKNNKKNKTCYNCEKKGHFKKECRSRKKQKIANTGSSHNPNVVEDDINKVVAMGDFHPFVLFHLQLAGVSDKPPVIHY
ncbi:hypothetical protein RJ640_030989 [Escallonia rubra]|uniref:CCHC-type domain-containing protein n=1 Tax=Escallonia rubra TaxID=112253 RepID=A0AA88RAX5_9ASTE|nr:hypothetical protein RJ640_030989 [Escallonia rubra]